MSQHTVKPWTKRPAWRIAGLWMVVLSLGLAVTGVVLAVQQARAFTQRLIAHAEGEASRVAQRAQLQFERELRDALRLAGDLEHGALESEEDWPVWLDGIFFCDAGGVRIAVPPTDGPAGLLEWVRATLPTWSSRKHEPSEPFRPELVYGESDHVPMVLGIAAVNPGTTDSALVAVHVNLPRLKSDLVEPLLAADAGLELAPAGIDYAPWSQPLFGAMRHWVIKPTDAFMREQRSAVVGQTAISLGLTLLALVALLIAMAVLIRVVRREISLAQMKANFVADVSHELKTPLALIRLYSETLESGRITTEEKRQEYYGIITRESTRLTNLINNILDFARIEAGAPTYKLEPVDMAEVVRDTYEAYRGHLDHDGFEHHLHIEANLPQVDADRDAIARALINLINNAIKYSSGERFLTIDVTSDIRRNQRGVLISMHDRGIGISPEDRARVFEGFFRSSDGRVRNQGGTGLGLALVKNIVDAHGGSLEVESRLVKGTTFRVFLPASERPAAAGEE